MIVVRADVVRCESRFMKGFVYLLVCCWLGIFVGLSGIGSANLIRSIFFKHHFCV